MNRYDPTLEDLVAWLTDPVTGWYLNQLKQLIADQKQEVFTADPAIVAPKLTCIRARIDVLENAILLPSKAIRVKKERLDARRTERDAD